LVAAVPLAAPPAPLLTLALELPVTLELVEAAALVVTGPALVLVTVAELVELVPAPAFDAVVLVAGLVLALLVEVEVDDEFDVTSPGGSETWCSVVLEHP